MSYATRKMSRIDRYRSLSYWKIAKGRLAARESRTQALFDMLKNLARARHSYAIECALDAHESALRENPSRCHDELAPADYIDGRESILGRDDVASLVALIPTLEGLCDPYLMGSDDLNNAFVAMVYLDIAEELRAGTWPVIMGRSPAFVETKFGAKIVLTPRNRR